VLTHIKRTENADEFLQRFLATLEGLERAKRLGRCCFNCLRITKPIKRCWLSF